jgi:hypothetical protein
LFQLELKADEVNCESLDISIKEEATITVQIVPNAQAFTMDYSNFKDSLMDLDYTSDHSVRTSLELVTSECLIST